MKKALPAVIDWTPPEKPAPVVKPIGHGYLIFSVDWDGNFSFLQSDILLEPYMPIDEKGNPIAPMRLDSFSDSHMAHIIEGFTDMLWDAGVLEYGGVYRFDGVLETVFKESGRKIEGTITMLVKPNPQHLAPEPVQNVRFVADDGEEVDMIADLATTAIVIYEKEFKRASFQENALAPAATKERWTGEGVSKKFTWTEPPF